LYGITTISISQLFDFVKTFDKNFYTNLSSPGRAERLSEISATSGLNVSEAVDEETLYPKETYIEWLERLAIRAAQNSNNVILSKDEAIRFFEEGYPIYLYDNGQELSDIQEVSEEQNELCTTPSFVYDFVENYRMDEIISRAVLTKEEAVQLFESGRAKVVTAEHNAHKTFTSVDEILNYNGELAFEPNSGLIEEYTSQFVEEIRDYVNHPPQEDYLTEVTKEEALRLYKSGRASVYKLYDNDAEGAVESVDDIEEYDGRFGFEHSFRDTAYIAEIREYLATPEIEMPLNTLPTYKPGDTVYLDNREFTIERMYEDSFGHERVDILPTTGYPVTGIFHVADLNRQLREDSRNNKYFADLAEKPLDVDSLEVGDIIGYEGKQWAITSIQGDFSAALSNLDKTDIQSTQAFIGHWKDRIVQVGATFVSKAKDLSDVQAPKTADKPKRTTTQNPNQESFFDMTETPEEVSATTGLSVSETPETPSVTETPKGENYRLLDSRDRWEGDKTRYADNVAAIKTLKLIENENREATSEEKNVLSRYVGWGGLPNAFNGADSSWIKEYRELNDLLTPEEYKAAQKSTLNAHYTSTTVIDSIYSALEKMGLPNGSRILEPSCGIGNFIGRMPESLSNCHVTGVELDSITGRIASKLYPQSDIQVRGFETVHVKNDTFGAVIGNVPFGAIKVNDKEYNHLDYNIHDYFLAKAIDKTAPGGVTAVVTSKFTLDKMATKQRKYFAERAELLGAIRLPNTAFKGNAKTEVTSDILFLQKRPYAISIPESGENRPAWIDCGQTEDGLPLNGYFLEHPEMILGTLVEGNKLYGNQERTTEVIPVEGAVLSEQLAEAVAKIDGRININIDNTRQELTDNLVKFAPVDSRKFSYILHNDRIYWREGEDTMKPLTLTTDTANARKFVTGEQIPKKYEDQLKSLIKLAETARTLLDYESRNIDESFRPLIEEYRDRLNDEYNSFVEKYGRISDKTNQKLLAKDNNGYLLSALEQINSKGEFESKSHIFYEDVIKPREIPSYVDNVKDALIISVSETAKVDIQFICELTKKSENTVLAELTRDGDIYKNPATGQYETADEYLSGNIREKINIAQTIAELQPEYTPNIAALQAVIPKRIEAADIYPHLGSTWIPAHYYSDFIQDLLKINWVRESIVKYNDTLDTFDLGKCTLMGSSYQLNINTYGINYSDASDKNAIGVRVIEPRTMSALNIIEGTLNGKILKMTKPKQDEDGNIIYKRDKEGNLTGEKEYITDPKATAILLQKQKEIRAKFNEWVFADRDRRETLVDIYNVQFNSIRLREFDGSHLNLKDKSPEITMRDHQLNAVAKSLYGGNTLLAHEVGAGKSYTQIATAMEGKRLGLHRKSLFVVPNHLTRQMGNDFLKLYPNANILVADKEDFKKENRKAFFARIATGEYDAVIIGHSQFERMSLSVEQQKKFMQHEINKFEAAKLELAGDDSDTGKRFTKALEKSLENYRVRLEKLMEQIPDDSVIDFEQLGIDKLFVDESHMFKNLETKSKFARGVAGMGNAHSNRAFDMFMKCSYLNEVTHGKGIVMSTGTPISNTLTEMYTLMRYMMPESELIKMKLDTFDKWASTFGQITTAMELKPESDGGYQMKTRFSKFDNLPELLTIFKTFADIQTNDTLNLPRPALVGIDKDGNRIEGKCTDVVAKPSRIQRKFIRELGERATEIRNGNVPPESDNMLCITSDGRKIGLDQRIIDPTAPDNPNSKVNMCVDRIAEIYHSTTEKKGTQLLFCDMSTPSAAKDGGFCLYHDIKDKLIAKGVKEEEIAFIHDCKSDEEKQNLYNRMTEGEIRVMLGSTTMCGAGMNAQKLMVALHDIDCPMRPSDMEQRHGRILRQGNDNKEVQIFRYVTDKTFVVY
jgi:N12 class adenine-specific DNA methylase